MNNLEYLAMLIPMDDLTWCKEDNKFILLTDEEIEKILIATRTVKDDRFVHPDMESEDYMKAIRWAEECRTGYLLLKRVLEGKIGIYASQAKTHQDVTFFPLIEEDENEED